MEEIIGQRKNLTGMRPNIKTNINNLNKPKKSFIRIIFSKFLMQIIICLCIIMGLVIYKNIQIDSYTYNVNKYKWIVNYTTTYNDIYNSIANYINKSLGFNIPLKKNNINNTLQENVENNNSESKVILPVESTDKTDENVVEVSSSYDNMKIMADELKQKYNFDLPTKGVVSCAFGNRNSSNKNISSFHLGIDVANDIGTEILAACEGIVEDVSYNNTYGNYIKIVRDDVLMVYAHCSKIFVSKGDKVKLGQKIALMGDTGNVTGPHLHFEVRKNGLVINPEYLINFR